MGLGSVRLFSLSVAVLAGLCRSLKYVFVLYCGETQIGNFVQNIMKYLI